MWDPLEIEFDIGRQYNRRHVHAENDLNDCDVGEIVHSEYDVFESDYDDILNVNDDGECDVELVSEIQTFPIHTQLYDRAQMHGRECEADKPRPSTANS